MTTIDSNSSIVAAYRAKTIKSAERYLTAKSSLPSGVTHDARHIYPHPIFVKNAAGARKWDVDGNEYVDYQGGHGALLLGHGHPEVMAAVAEQLTRGTHYGACHDLELEWAELVKELIPCAERVRFTSSGTEATMMAVRLARAFTGRSKLVRLRGHFHGWNDHMAFGYANHFDGTPSPGVVNAVAENVVLVDPNDGDGLKRAFSENDNIAAAILEPTGSSFGQIPLSHDFIALMRQLTAAQGSLLIFDEVVTGFRVSSGGAQAELGITPDLTTLAKILAGGLPGGAVTGREDVLDRLDHDWARISGGERILHPGTYNANPVSAAAGCTTLKIIRDTDACARAVAIADKLRSGINAILRAAGIPWAAYGSSSGVHIFLNTTGLTIDHDSFDPLAIDYATFKANKGTTLATKLRLGLRVNGVDISGWPGGPTSSAHGDKELDQTLNAFEKTVQMLQQEGELPD